MSAVVPWLLRLPRAVLARRDALEREALRVARARGLDAEVVKASFAFKCDELLFARELLERHPRYWLFRAHQQRRCGDFVLLDLSCVRPEQRLVRVLELKRNEAVRVDRGGGLQLSNALEVPGFLEAETGLVSARARVECVVGGARELLHWLA